jgi:fermentation-respiration switch protein FrsA (DUF1100 family)
MAADKYDEQILIDTTACQQPGEAEHDPTQKRVSHKRGFVEVLKVVATLGLKNSFKNVFYRPSRERYRTPDDLHPVVTPHKFASGDGPILSGWMLHNATDRETFGTVIQFHGCCHNMTFDAHQVEWLTGYGFDVFMFDYRGYGESEGAPCREGVHTDSLAALRFLRTIDGVDAERIFVLGQSLGGCIGLAALCDDELRGVRAIAVDGTFGSYRALVNSKMTNTRLTYPLASLIVNDDLAPIERIAELSPVPLAFFHGTRDKVIPFELGNQLYERAREPKVFHRVDNAAHMRTFTEFGDRTRPLLVEFFKSCLP